MNPSEVTLSVILKLLAQGAIFAVLSSLVRVAYEKLSFTESLVYAGLSTVAGSLVYYFCVTSGFSEQITIGATIGASLVAREMVGMVVGLTKTLAKDPLYTVVTIAESMTSQIPNFKKYLEDKKNKKQKKSD